MGIRLSLFYITLSVTIFVPHAAYSQGTVEDSVAFGPSQNAGDGVTAGRDPKLIVVEAERTRTDTIDSTLFLVSNSPEASTLDGLEAIGQVPIITVDRNGSIRLMGRSGVAVLVDGKEVPNVIELLRGIRADQIEAIEVVTNASARFSASDRSGVINIRLREIRGKKSRSTFVSSLESDEGGRFSISSSGGAEELSYSASASVSIDQASTETLLLCIVDQASVPCDAGPTQYSSLNTFETYSANFGLVYEPAPKLRLNGKIFLSRTLFGRRQSSGRMPNFLSEDELASSGSISTNSSVGIDYGDSDDEFVRLRFDSSIVTTVNETFFFKENVIGNYLTLSSAQSQHELSGDARVYLGEEIPVRLGFSRTWDNQSQRQESINSAFEEYLLIPVGFQGDIDSIGIYGDVQFQAGAIKILPGLRWEQRDYGVGGSVSSSKRFSGFFPSVHFELQPAKDTLIKASYSKRVAWPSLNDLNAITRPQGLGFFTRGDSNLEPQLTEKIELAFTDRWEKTSVGVTLSYGQTDNVFSVVAEAIDDGFLIRGINAGRTTAYGGFAFIRGPLIEGVTYNVTGRGEFVEFNCGDTGGCGHSSDFEWNISSDVTYREQGSGDKGGDQFRLAVSYSSPVSRQFISRGAGSSLDWSWTHWWSERFSSIVSIDNIGFTGSSRLSYFTESSRISQVSRQSELQVRASLVLSLEGG